MSTTTDHFALALQQLREHEKEALGNCRRCRPDSVDLARHVGQSEAYELAVAAVERYGEEARGMEEQAEYGTERDKQTARPLKSLKPLETCQACGGDIYPGQRVYVIDAHQYIIHASESCLAKYYAVDEMTIEEALGVELTKNPT